MSDKNWSRLQYIRDPRYRIWYLVPQPDQEFRDEFWFQFYSPGIRNNAGVLARLATWPGDIREWSSSPEWTLFFRVQGLLDRRVAPIEFSAFEKIANDHSGPFLCVVSTADSCEFVTRTIAACRNPWMHVSTERISGAVFIQDVTTDVLRDHAANALRHFAQRSVDPAFIEAATEILRSPIHAQRETLDGVAYHHDITLPNEIALQAFKFDLTGHQPLLPNETLTYISASIESARLVERARQALLGTKPVLARNRFTVSVMSPAWSVRNLGLDRRKLADAGLPGHLNDVLQSFLRQDRHYPQFRQDSAAMLTTSEYAQAIMTIRQEESGAYVASLSLRAAHDMTPVLQLEPRLNRIRTHLSDIGSCARGSGPHSKFKLRKLFMRMTDALPLLIDDRYLDLLSEPDGDIEGLSLVTDLPLEFLPINGAPLWLTHDCSRIPLNPGDASFALLTRQQAVLVPVKAFSDVLIIRSFAAGDPLQSVLEMSIKILVNGLCEMPNIRFVDVETPEQFISAVNNFTGALMVFDGHGSRDPVNHAGSLVLGGKPFDPWAYRNELNLPPIVVLSACDTFPLDGSHGSSALGLLMAGARTVLGTTLPIDALTAAKFISCLLCNIAGLLPKVATHGPFEWRRFLADLLRMTHVVEILTDAMERFDAPEDLCHEIQILAHTEIISGRRNWHRLVDSRMRSLLPSAWLRESPGAHVLNRLTDSAKYVQLGDPESVCIVPDVETT